MTTAKPAFELQRAAYTTPKTPAQRVKLSRIFMHLFLIFIVGLVIAPIIWLLITSLKQRSEYLTYPLKWLPAVLQWTNYQQALTMVPFWRYFGNSLFLGLVFSTLTVITSSMAGFAFARLSLSGRSRLFGVILGLLVVPTFVTVIPQFVIFSRLHITDTYWPWVLWGLGGSPFHIFLFRQFFLSIPKELEDAAEVDGAGIGRIYWQIFLPNAKPAIATSFILNFAGVWGDWFAPVIYLSDKNTTLAVAVAHGYADPQGHTLVPIALAAAVLYLAPLVIMFLFGQKYIVRGVLTSGIKG
jgi:multiple sugar transport system permease protein